MPDRQSRQTELCDFIASHLLQASHPARLLVFHITIDVKPSHHRAATPSRLLAEFDHVYRCLIRVLVGRNYQRKPHLQPRAVAAFDRVGSKRESTAATTLDAWPHLHVVMTLSERLVSHLDDDEIEQIFIAAVSKSVFFETPYVQMEMARRRAVGRLVAYALKDISRLENQSIWGQPAYDIWPRLKSLQSGGQVRPHRRRSTSSTQKRATAASPRQINTQATSIQSKGVSS